ncbi:lecithin retinol acyltransferase domain-containing protein [Ditylenchus destructor]|nr:lecithin retinol acyltransferase domain-containing protein [Ditylenchus destructor]
MSFEKSSRFYRGQRIVEQKSSSSEEVDPILEDFRSVIGAMSGHETVGAGVKTPWCKGGKALIQHYGDELKTGQLLEFKMAPFTHHWLIVMLHSSGRPYVISAYDGRRNDPARATKGFIEYDLVEKITESVRINTEVDEDQECRKILGDPKPLKDIMTDALNSLGEYPYCLITRNCGTYVNEMRYGVTYSFQTKFFRRIRSYNNRP